MMEIYTDGGCSGNPGPGGWAYVILVTTFQGPKIVAEKCGAERDTTNNRMELMGAISAMEALKTLPSGAPRGRITVYTDSQYVQKGITEWIQGWKAHGWRNSDKEPVRNQDLWRRLDSLVEDKVIKWVWVQGHAGETYNERCDALTQKAIASLVKRKKKG
ncbi:MAG: ribonuclease HI [Treponema sp.]|jgi:ribonuclease HI|nr:ribonuclease HI [Treponema sp.]